MRIRLEKRLTPSRFMQVATPGRLRAVDDAARRGDLRIDRFRRTARDLRDLHHPDRRPLQMGLDVLTKAAPLIIIALGLSLGNQAKIWNIGAEGQYIIGAIAGAGVAFALPNAEGFWIIPLMMRGRDRGRHGLGGDPGIPQDALPGLRGAFDADAGLCRAAGAQLSDRGPVEGSERPQFPPDPAADRRAAIAACPARNRSSAGLVVAIVLTLVFWLLTTRSVYGFSVRRSAPPQARHATAALTPLARCGRP